MTTTRPGTIAAAPATPDRDGAAREARFTAAVGRLRTRVRGANIDRWFRVAGPILMPLGALMIVLAWWGTANTTRVFLQIPYLISGGLLGLGFIFAGGFVYFSRWLTDLLAAVRAESRRAEGAEARAAEALERIESLLRAADLASPTPGSVPVSDATAVEGLVTTEHGKLVHFASCRLVAGRPTRPASAAQVTEREPCRICASAGIDDAG